MQQSQRQIETLFHSLSAEHLPEKVEAALTEQTDALVTLHRELNGRLLRIYRFRSPRIRAWLKRGSPIARWLGSPSAWVTLSGVVIVSAINLCGISLPLGFDVIAILILAIFVIFAALNYYFLRLDHDIFAEEDRMQAYAEAACECIAVGTTHITIQENGIFWDRIRTFPVETVVLIERPGRVELTYPDNRPLMKVYDAWTEVIGGQIRQYRLSRPDGKRTFGRIIG